MNKQILIVPGDILLSIKNQLKNPLFILFCIAFVIRLVFGIIMYTMDGTSKFVDEWDYISYAKNILNQGIWVPDISKLYSNSHLAPPGFPLILAGLFFIFGENYLIIVLFNALISTMVIVLIFFLGKEIFNKKIGMFAAIWATFYIQFFMFIPTPLKEVSLTFIFLSGVYLLILETKRNRISWKLFFPIIIFTLTIHIDERYFVYFPIFVISFLFLDNNSLKNGIKKATLFFLMVCLLMVPWSIRNYNVYGNRVVILTERTARYTDKVFGYDPLLSHYGKKNKKYAEFKWDESLIDDILAGKEVPGLKGKRYRSLREGLQQGYIPHKFNTFERWKSNIIEHWRPLRFKSGYATTSFRFIRAWSLKHNISVGICYGVLLPFFLLGCFLILKYKNKYGIFLCIIILVNTLIHVLIMGKERYRVPIDPFIIIIAIYGIYHIYLKYKSKASIDRPKILEF